MAEVEMWRNTFCFLFVIATIITGEEVTITTPHVTHDPQDKCLFPDVLVIELLRSRQEMRWSIKLNRDNVIPYVRSVLLMTDTPSRSVETYQVVSDHHDGVQAYHNRSYGAAFTVKCTRRHEHRSYFLLEGSLFHANQKYRIIQSSSQRQHTEVFPSYVTAIYRMEEISELKAGDTTVIGPSSIDTARDHYSSRYKRAVTLPATYNIDILPVVDSTLYDRFYNINNGDINLTINNIADYLAVLFASVGMRFNTLALETRTLKIRMISPLVLTTSNQLPYTASDLENENGVSKINAETLLRLFKNWLIGNKNLVPNDHAMFFTAVKIYGGLDSGIKFNITKGLAYVGTMCKADGESSSIVEDTGAYQSEGVAAHELGHCLGSNHDGDKNMCHSSDRYIMSDGSYPETESNALHPWRFSSCSSNYMVDLLKSLETNNIILQGCLINAIGSIKTGDNTLSASQQCKAFYGVQSYVCRGAGIPSFDKLCDEFYCKMPGTTSCERMIAATSTCCGNKKKCIQGQCVDAGQGQCPMNDKCPLGDQEGEIVENMSCSQLHSGFCYQNDVYLKCCDTCEKHRLDQQDCTFGDKQLGCKKENCFTTFTSGVYNGQSYNSVCCSTCTNVCIDASSLTTSSGNYACNDYILNQGKKNVCYQTDIHQHACCKTCEDAKDATNVGRVKRKNAKKGHDEDSED